MKDYSEIRRLAEKCLADQIGVSADHHDELSTAVLALIAENERLKDISAELSWSESDSRKQGAEIIKLKAEIEALRQTLTDCSGSLHSEMLQKFGAQLPDDMHPVTRREYDRDMAEVAGYRAALGNGDQS